MFAVMPMNELTPILRSSGYSPVDSYDVPHNPVPHTPDVWADLSTWLGAVSVAMRGPYGEVLRTSTAIGATEPALGVELAQAFGHPATADIHGRLIEAVEAGQISKRADLEATIDLLMAIIVYVGATRERRQDPGGHRSHHVWDLDLAPLGP